MGRLLAHEADRLVGGSAAALVIDDMALPKQGMLSVGVARQYSGALGKRANCQSLLSLTLAQDEVPVPVALRLFLGLTCFRGRHGSVARGVPDAQDASAVFA